MPFYFYNYAAYDSWLFDALAISFGTDTMPVYDLRPRLPVQHMKRVGRKPG